ncbi:PREDICTED: coiled-coil domain-containing protein lobo homolog [Ceratosolen solmsi marchali]|uniref:Coiled-coil domain-containing protein lobo homolog n=1 Tax=Ceratosolen solmsi marchali TaxID=326594 RepID=A0AAJ7E1S3_9HYME|nr:PREDICTED: coiled-coil domain-containing protein lobo homolog [Ceratosolen solmsi marchali]
MVKSEKPKHLYSPTYLVHNRRANSFEMSTFMVSLLLGLGYNAYVINGYASSYQTLCDQTLVLCPYLPPSIEPSAPTPSPFVSKYKPTPPADLTSKFLRSIEEREQQKIQKEYDRQEEEHMQNIANLEKPKRDPLFGMRVHSWVLLLPNDRGPRSLEITEPLFIEPATGYSYSVQDQKIDYYYLGIESLWNSDNYWVNMQDCAEACTKLKWDLTDTHCWEHLLAGEPTSLRKVNDVENPDISIREEFHLVMPPSYISRIQISNKDYEQRYPNGTKSIYFKKTKVYLYAPFSRNDGLIESVTLYDDYKYKNPIYIYEKYQEREDKLIRSEKNLCKETITDYYSNGRIDACKAHQYFIKSKGTIDEERTLEFYNKKRLDELASFHLHSLFTSQNYKNRNDNLYNRFVEYSVFNDNLQNNIHERTIIKIVENFHRNIKVTPNKDIATREFDFIKNEIRLKFHYCEGQYTQATRTFIKPPITDRGDRLVYSPHMTQSYNPDPMAEPENFDDLIELLETLLSEEETCIVEIRKGETAIFKFLEDRANEFKNPKLKISPYNPIRNEDAKTTLLTMEEEIRIRSEQKVDIDTNFLAPYIMKLGNVKYLTNKQASQIRNECLEHFKQTSINRANCMKKDYKKCSDKLIKIQATLTQSEGLTKEEKEDLSKTNNSITLKLHALEVRLNRHRELIPIRYRKLLEFLQNDNRLSILYDQ